MEAHNHHLTCNLTLTVRVPQGHPHSHPHFYSVIHDCCTSSEACSQSNMRWCLQGLLITFTIQGLNVHSPEDISITMFSNGVSMSLAATQAELLSCSTAGCTTRVMLSLPLDEPEGTKLMTFASQSCSSSQITMTAYVTNTKAVPYPNRMSNLGGDTIALYVENAPHSTQLPFDKKNVKVVCTPNEVSAAQGLEHCLIN